MFRWVFVVTMMGLTSALGAAAAANTPDECNVVWETPSEHAGGSMPLGNGDLGLNVWVEGGGDLLFYLSKTDAWSGNGRLLKLGRVRVSLTPNPFAKGLPFRQTLRLSAGEITIAAGAPQDQVELRVWVDAGQPVVWLELDGKQEFAVQVRVELWRDRERELSAAEADSAFGLLNRPERPREYPDTVVPGQPEGLLWYHRNEVSCWAENLDLQGLAEFRREHGLTDPLLHRTFGALVRGDGLEVREPLLLASPKPGPRFVVSLHPLTAITATGEDWVRQVKANAAAATPLADARRRHQDWWQAFWARSWIQVSGSAEAATVTRGYALQRFISACGGRGNAPIKFNGSIFTVDPRHAGVAGDPDYRRWGEPYWWQNTRLAYWPLLAAGDFDLMRPLFRLYHEALPLAQARTRLFFAHDGAFFPEVMTAWGTFPGYVYGWDRRGQPVSNVANRYTGREYTVTVELLALMADYYAATSDPAFLRDELLPLADALLCFWEQHWPREAQGRLRLEPAQALETWWDVTNPTPDVAGLHWVLDRLLALPDLSPERRARWGKLREAVPPVPLGGEPGKTRVLPAQEVRGGASNCENAELYAVWPFRLYGVGRPAADIGRATFAARPYRSANGWGQDPIQAACLGLTNEARAMVARSFAAHHAGSRFPAFWGPNFDWVPDQDHGGVAMIALQCMLLQADGRRLLLFPAWPRDWDVDFRLHAPLGTIVTASLRAGKLTQLDVTPPERAADVVNLLPP